MPLFTINGNDVERVHSDPFDKEKNLQNLVETNLLEMFGINFIESEYTTSEGRIDTFGVDENGTPVIIEYKKNESSSIASQALFYLNWVIDHKAQIEKDVEEVNEELEVNWNTGVRVVLIAQKFDKYTKKAVTQMKPRIELKKYIRYENGNLYIEDVTPGIKIKTEKSSKTKSEETSKPETTVEEVIDKTGEKTKPIFSKLRDKIINMGEDVIEKPTKHYLTYRVDRNFAELIPGEKQVNIFLDIPKKNLEDPKNKLIDKSEKGHLGTGQTKLIIKKEEELNYAEKIIKQSYEYTQ